MDYTYADIAGMIDHSLLAPTLNREELEAGCRLAREYEVASVCILPHALRRADELLSGSTVQPSSTVGFPHGGQATGVKVAEAEQALADGATELDMVVNISRARSRDWDYVREDISAVLESTHARRMKLKVIFENCYLAEAEKIRLCEICGELGVDWVKTSTGFGPGGATDEDLQLMRTHSPAYVQLKAADGIRDLDRLLRVRELGCSRCGTTRTRDILDELKRRLAAG
ncbi:MAG: deoxyribose-phosphate aldolase [Vicinamibacteria bacterium]